jgi:hypothetical protein
MKKIVICLAMICFCSFFTYAQTKIAKGYVCAIGIGSSGDGTISIYTENGKMEFTYWGRNYDKTKKTIVVRGNRPQGQLFQYLVTVYYKVDMETSTIPLYDAVKIILQGKQKRTVKECYLD